MSKKKTHYYGASDPVTIKRNTDKLIFRTRLELLKVVLKVAAGITVISPLNAPFGWPVQLTASLIWVSYCWIDFYLSKSKSNKFNTWYW